MSKLPLCGFGKALVIPFFIFFLATPFFVISSEIESRNDLIFIQLSDDTATRQMPDALFLHDKHTRALADSDCSKCHMKEKGEFVFKFNRIKDAGYDADKKMYHAKCIGCHQEKRDQGVNSGPLSSECRLCHSRTSAYQSSAMPFGMDKSLHYRHEIAESIPSTGDEKDWNCGACHHQYDPDLEKTVYVKGEESTCRYCHKAEKTETARSFQTVAHEDCINCHLQLKSDDKKAGPAECAACHDAENQSKIQTIEEVPRIRRNQPDRALLSLWLKEAVDSGKPSSQFMKPVAFDHKSHEAGVENCYSCHHSSMSACVECHTRTGSEKSDDTRLESAMHAAGSPVNRKSCISCHNEKVQKKDCAGCHSQMRRKSFTETDCIKCHAISRETLDPVPVDDKKILKIAETEINLRKTDVPQIPEKDIPEQVTIDVLKDQYEAATFPHRKIVNALFARTQKSDLATHFHGNAKTLCVGCHHHTPASLTPPKCASCHGISRNPDGRPGLKGAYHVQCIRCHTEMGMEKPAATDCVACHKQKTESALLSD